MNRTRVPARWIGAILVLVLAIGCSASQAAPTLPRERPWAAPAAGAEAIVKEWIIAWQSKDAEKYIALFSEDGETMFAPEPGFLDSGPQKVKGLEGTIRENFASKDVRVTSYFISADGRSAAAEGTFTMYGKSGAKVTVPVAFILRFRDGKIASEILYYDGSPFY